MVTAIIGWLSSAVLLATIARQVFTQWKSGQTAGISRWLFLGQVTASTGFAVYSFLLQNWVFLATNLMLIAAAVAGELIYLQNRRKHPAPTT
jgi:uncharacterized protein with PQ loop repeat